MRDRSRSPRSSSETLDLSGVPMSQVGQGQVAAEAAKLFEDNLETPPPRQPASETATGGQSSWTRLVEAPLSRFAHDEMMETTKDMLAKELNFSTETEKALQGDDGDAQSPGPDVGQKPDAKDCLHRGLLPPILEVDKLEHKPVLAWRDQLLIDFKPGFDEALFMQPVKLSTMCTGPGAARLSLEWMGCPVKELLGCDPKKPVRTMQSNFGHEPDHFVSNARQVAHGQGHCFMTGKFCDLPLEREDLCTAGFPCQPFSTQRPARWQEGWQSHKEAQVMTEVAEAVAIRQPFLLVLENVPGFLRQHRTDLSKFSIIMAVPHVNATLQGLCFVPNLESFPLVDFEFRCIYHFDCTWVNQSPVTSHSTILYYTAMYVNLKG